jgi:thymidylate synthase (FAD)
MRAEYVDHMGSDLSVVNAARVSMEKESDWHFPCDKGGTRPHGSPTCSSCWCSVRAGKRREVLCEADQKLIAYLSKHNHWTPFAHTAITLRVGAPVPIRTQCFKHKAGFVENEESRRYISSKPEVYFPTVWRSKPEGSIKQGSGTAHPDQEHLNFAYRFSVNLAVDTYEEMLRRGVCPEQARFVLPQGCMVNWIWTGNLASYARFYALRTDPHAQREVQDLAVRIGRIIEPLYPVSWKALTNG